MAQKNYAPFAELSNIAGNSPPISNGMLFYSEDANKPLWRIVTHGGADCFFNTLGEATRFYERYGYRIIGRSGSWEELEKSQKAAIEELERNFRVREK